MKIKTKKTPRRTLIKKLDIASRKLVYIRDNYTCQHCGKCDGRDYQASHVVPVSAGNKLRWDVQNMKVLCHFCHLHWWHKNPIEAAKWFNSTFPERAAYLEENKGMYKFSVTELEDLLTDYSARLDKLTTMD